MYTSSGILCRENRIECQPSGLKPVLIMLALAVFAILVSCATPGKEAPPEKGPGGTGSPVESTAPVVREPDIPAELPVETGTQGVLTRIARLLSERKYAEALGLFDEIDPADAEIIEIQLIKASLYNSAGESGKARDIANGILANQPENIDALLTLSASAAVEGKDREQRTILERLIKIDPKNVKALCDLGYIALRAKSLRTAANYFDQALAADKTSGEALIGRAIIYRYNRDSQKSEQLLNQAINLYPQWASPLHERARLYKGAGFNRDALADFDAAKKLEPNNYWISVDRGMILFDMNRKQDALEEFSRAVALDPDNFLAYVYTAGLKDDSGDYDGAEKDFTMIAKLKPEYYFAFEGLGILKMKKHDWVGARDAFLSAYRYAPKEYGYALLAAVNWMRSGRIGDPKQFLAQVLRTAPRDTADWYILRLYHDLSGDLDIALRIEKEVNFDNKSRMLFYLANYYDIRGNKNLADKYFLQVQELNRQGIPEWRLNEWFIEQRGLNPF